MKEYSINDVLRIAKRHNNSKRSYLLVNPLQGKHLPISPTAALDMMKALSDKVASKYPDSKLTIGFAETATAIGAVVAVSLAEDCVYIHTTREDFSREYHFTDFLEEQVQPGNPLRHLPVGHGVVLGVIGIKRQFPMAAETVFKDLNQVLLYHNLEFGYQEFGTTVLASSLFGLVVGYRHVKGVTFRGQTFGADTVLHQVVDYRFGT